MLIWMTGGLVIPIEIAPDECHWTLLICGLGNGLVPSGINDD